MFECEGPCACDCACAYVASVKQALKGTFQDSVANLYNVIPASIRSIPDYHLSAKECTKILRSRVTMRLN